ncbi:tRNA lysidine(34) synthetase TilS [Novosphingobium sp. SL115]|uniref:tRNA lysidine(34) synthetase TilS n=1 Tax=Novosphingobium sp. SL115 TaxID=2995150 RepID=UPI002275E13B|nr:tRNA lysidine(34) synthetase TilS [Novosphingobium sp. SL115]MCY1670374.1 tRNA lysidine(34) synthetase TilS [Novosphingobium sp. SL115]
MGLAVSGGADSLALLLLFHEVAPRNFCVATVDHGLRPEAADEAAMVADVCKARDISHTTLTLALPKGSAVQERARLARYAALAGWARGQGLAALVTAHHADDQAETMVMRLNRGAGLRGLAGMRSRSATPGDLALPLLRPLLSWRRADLAAVVAAAGIGAVEDPSNRDHRYERVRVRDALTSNQVFDANGFANSAAHLADADAALDWAAQQLWRDVVFDGQGFTWNVPSELPQALGLRVLEHVLNGLEAHMGRGSDVVRWLEALSAGRVATLAGIKGDPRKGPWRFTRVPPHR